MKRFTVSYSACLIATLLCATGSVVAGDPAEPPGSDQPMIGEDAPAFSLMDVNDQRTSSDDLRGSYVVVHFAASW